MPADRNAHSETSRGGNTRKRRTWTRLAIAAVVVVAIISSAAAARTWRRAQQEESARARGLAAFDRSEWNLALRELGLLVGRGTDDVEVLLAFATARMHVPMEHGAQVATAIFAIDRAREFGADDVRCAQLRLRAYVGGGMLAEAQREAEHVLAIDERDREARRVYVHASCARGRFEDAEKVLRRAVNLEPTSLANRIALAEILVKRARAAALDRPPDRAASETILDEVTSWAREPDAPSGVGELVHAIALELAIRSRESLAKDVAGPERGAQTMEEAELRARVLDEVGRQHEGNALLTQRLHANAPKSAERVEIARTLFRRAIFAGDFASARTLLATEFADLDGESLSDLSVVYRTVLALVDGAESDEIVRSASCKTNSRETHAWLSRVQSLVSGEIAQSAQASETIDAVAEAALRVAEAQRAAEARKWPDALRCANDAVQLSRGRFDLAEIVAIESLHELGQYDEALARSTRLVDISNGRSQARALRLLSEMKLDTTASRQGMRAPELRVVDARAILNSNDATLRDNMIATLVLGSAGYAEEARTSFAQGVERAQWQDSECVELSESVVFLARALNDMSYLSIGRDVITHKASVATEDSRWAIAWIDALAAEREADVARAWSTLCAAAPTKRARLAIIGEFGDRHGIEAAPSMLRASLPEGASIVSGTRAVMDDPQLALETLRVLKQSSDLRTIALLGLRFATVHPAHFDPAEILAVAADARRVSSRNAAVDVELLVAIAGLLLSTSPPDPAQALLLLEDAIRSTPADRNLREYAGHAALLAGDPQRAQEHANALASADPHGIVLRAQIAIAVGDGRRAEAELARLKDGGRDLPRFPGSEISSLHALALILQGVVERVPVDQLPMESVRVARMIPAEDHHALVLHCERLGADRVLVAHLAAEYLHRQMHGEIVEIARSVAQQLQDRNDTASAIAAYRAAVACGDQGLTERTRETLAKNATPRAVVALRREEAVALLVRDPERAHAIATEILEEMPDDTESVLLALASATALGKVSARDSERLARLPKSPESHLLEARRALLAGREFEARRAAREGIELASRRAYVSFDTRAALRAIVEMSSSHERMVDESSTKARVDETESTALHLMNSRD